MIKRLILAFMAVLLMSVPAMAEDTYISIGGVYAIENFDTGLIDFDNTEGLNLRAGCNITDTFAVELTYDYLPGFSWSYDGLSADADIETLMLAGKLSTGEKVRPYFTGGIGVMRGDLTVSYLGQALTASESDMCGKAGIGVDYFIEDNVSLGLEGAYVVGFGDMDMVEYTMITCGVALHF